MFFLKKVNSYLTNKQNIFDYDIKKHLQYLHHFPEPKNLIQRSFYQYKCQNFQRLFFTNLRNGAIALITCLPLTTFMLLKPKRNIQNSDKGGAIFIFGGVEKIVPLSIKQKYNPYKEVEFGKDWFLTSKDLRSVLLLLKYFYSPFFVVKCLYKLAMYRAVIDAYQPNAIICSSEYSFTSSFLTWYCEQNQIQHINVMHGEKLLNIRDSFFQFHKCYVWDHHYINIFNILRASKDQFVIESPPSLEFKFNTQKHPIFLLTYYLAGETKNELLRVRNTLEKIKIPIDKICIRPHPRYSNFSEVKSIFHQFHIENPSKITIEESLSNTRRIASLYSTVLYQGVISGKEIVIDDVSQETKYKKLNQLDFIIFSKEYKIMSALLDK